MKDLGNPQRMKLLSPDIELLGALLGKDHLPVADPHGCQQAVVAPVIETVARPSISFTRQVRQKIISVQMVVIFPAIDRDTRFQLVCHGRAARR